MVNPSNTFTFCLDHRFIRKVCRLQMMMPLILLLVISMTTLPPSINAIVPPKTPVLSGFEPAAIESYRELVCDASQPGAGSITYKWYKYSVDKGVEDWEKKGPIVKGTSQKYIFNLVTEEKVFYPPDITVSAVSGKYKCRASNSAGTRDSEWGDLYVYKPCSLYTVSVTPAKPAIGSTFTLNCNIRNPSGFAVNWLKKADASSTASGVAVANSKGCHAPSDSRYSWSSCSPPSISSKTKTFNLQVTNAQPADFAYWTCKDIGLSCISHPVKPVVQAIPGTPQINGFPSGPVTTGTQLNLNCTASPTGDTYDWYKDGSKVSTSFTYDFDVTNKSVGVYKCEARNEVGKATSSNKTLVMYSKPDSVEVSSGKTSSHVGETDKFTCTVTGGNPTPNVTIYFKRSGGTPVKVTQGQDRVMAKEDNQAEYYCDAKVTGYPALDMTSSRKVYNVTFPPNGIQISETSITVKEGDSKTITCSTTSSSNPAVSGVSVKKRLGSSDVDVTGTSRVTNGAYHGKDISIDIKLDTNRTDNGAQYICSFTYASTTFTKTATVNVHWLATELKMVEKPSVPITAGVGVTIKCETDSSNPGSPISWYRNGQQITNGVTPSRTLALDGGTIYISVLTFIARKQDNKEKYECKINDQANFKEEVTIKVNFSNTKVSFLHNPTDAVQAGLVKKFTCETDESNPITSIQWHQYIGSSWRDITTGISSSERNGVYGGKIRISEWAVTANKTMNKVALRCKSTYPLTGHVFTTIANTTMNVIWSATELKMVEKPSVPITAGVGISIKCETDSSNQGSPGAISWYGNGQQITTGVTPSTRQVTDGGTIYISQLTFTAQKEDNQAKYECKINDQANFKKDVTITVNFPPNGIQLSETSITVKEGVTKTITCSTTSSSNPAVSGISVKKRLGSSEVNVTGTSIVTNGAYYGKDVSIDIKLDTNRTDNGAQYNCSFTYASTTFKENATVNIQFNPLKITMLEHPLTAVHEGKPFNIVCETDSANPVANIQFHRNRIGGTWAQLTSGITSEDRAAEYNGRIRKSTLNVTANRLDNEAVFKCEVKEYGSFQVNQTTVNVSFPPNVRISSSPKPVKEGDTLTLTCAASGGNPIFYTYKWFYENKEIPTETSKDYTITSIKYTQSGPYRCQATNYSPGGKADGSLDIDVQYKARWNPELPEVFYVASKLNTSMKFVLHVIANPSPTKVTWFFSNTATLGEAFNATKVNETMYTLSKQSVGVNDYGNYTVNVTNAVGVSTFTFELKKAGPPDTPCCLGLVNATAVSITLTFTSGFAGGSAQTFTIENRTSGGNVWDIAVKGIADPGIGNNVTKKISGLDSNTDYEFRVKATNDDGDSGYGKILAVKTEAAPNATLTVERKDNQVTVSWPKLLKNYTKIRIKYCQKGASCDYHDVADPTSLKSSFTVKEGNTYTYSMIIFDGEDLVFTGTSAPRNAPSPVTPPGTPVGQIAGGVGGVLFLLIIIAVVLVMKRRQAEKDAEILNTSNNNGDANGGQVNPGFSDLDTGHSDVTDGFNPYEDSVEMTSPSSSIQIEATAVAGGAEYAVVNKKGSKKPPVGDAYAEVDLKKKRAGKKGSAPPQPGGQAYAEVDFSKKSKGKGKGKAPVPSADPGGQAYAEVDFTKKAKKGEVPASSAGPGDVYAEVSKPKKPSKPTKPGKSGSDDQAVYANVPNGDVDEENLYEDVRKEEPIENGYRQPKEAYQVGVDGTIYSQLQISPPKNPDVIRGMDTIEEYASVDFSLQAPPLPEPEDPDDPNDPGFLVLL